jgi:hypothetical protein
MVWAVLPCRLVKGFLHMVLPTCQPNLHSVTFKQTISAINSLCCLNNEVWFFCITVFKHISLSSAATSAPYSSCQLLYNTVRFCACMIHYDFLVICLKSYNICCNLKTMQWQEKCVFRRKRRPYCSHQNILLCKNNEESVHILASLFSYLISWST